LNSIVWSYLLTQRLTVQGLTAALYNLLTQGLTSARQGSVPRSNNVSWRRLQLFGDCDNRRKPLPFAVFSLLRHDAFTRKA